MIITEKKLNGITGLLNFLKLLFILIWCIENYFQFKKIIISLNIVSIFSWIWGLPGGIVVKICLPSAGNTREAGSILGSRRFPGVGNGNLLQHVCVRNPVDRGAWWVTVHGVAKSWIWVSTRAHIIENVQYWKCK